MRAIGLHEQGYKTAEIARKTGRSTRSVQAWIAAFAKRGQAGIAAKKHPGAKPKLAKRQRNGLQKRLIRGAVANGFATQVWTAPRVRQLIQEVYGVEYHVGYVPSLLKALGFTRKKPAERARERDDAAVAEWVRRDWPRIKKKRRSAEPR